MYIGDYFKKTLEDLFLHCKVMHQNYYQELLNRHCQGVAKVKNITDKRIEIEFAFEDYAVTFAMEITNTTAFPIVYHIYQI